MKYLHGDFNSSRNSHWEKKKKKTFHLQNNEAAYKPEYLKFCFILFLFNFFLITKVSEKIPGVNRVDEKSKFFKVELVLLFFAFHGNPVHCPAEEHMKHYIMKYSDTADKLQFIVS